MPKTTSAKKRLRQEGKHHQWNLNKKEAYKKVKRQIKKALPKGGEALGDLIKTFQKAIDKAAKTGVIHKNKAAREKSRLARLVKKTGGTSETKASPKKGKAKARKAVKKKASSRKRK